MPSLLSNAELSHYLMKIPHSFRTIVAAITGIILIAVDSDATEPTSLQVTAGTLYGTGGSTNGVSSSVLQAYYGPEQPDGEGVIYQVLDLGNAINVDKIDIINRRGFVSTNYSIDRMSIRVASDESSPNFNPLSLSSYNTIVFEEGNVKPRTNAPDAVRTIDIDDSRSRYFLLEFTKTFRSPVGRGEGFDSSVQFADITITKS